MSYYRSTNLFVHTDVSTAITNKVVLYVFYYNNLPLILLSYECKVTLEQVMMTYTESGEMSLLFSTLLLNGAECPMPHNGQGHKVFTIFPYKIDSKNVTTCRELQWQTDDTFNSQVGKQCLLYFDIQESANKTVLTQ